MNSGKSYDLIEPRCRCEKHADYSQYVSHQIIDPFLARHDLYCGSCIRVFVCSCRLVPNQADLVLLLIIRHFIGIESVRLRWFCFLESLLTSKL
jgi:hypothetical protein